MKIYFVGEFNKIGIDTSEPMNISTFTGFGVIIIDADTNGSISNAMRMQ